MQPAPEQALAEALAVSERMLAAGRDGDWPRVIALEPGRRKLLVQAFSAGTIPASVSDRIRDILALDRELIDLGAQARDAVAQELSQIQRGSKANRAYRSHR